MGCGKQIQKYSRFMSLLSHWKEVNAMYYEFANACVAARETMNISQERLAELCEVTRQSISDYECGKALPSEKVAKRLIEKLDSPTLGYAYLRSNKIGQDLLPPIPERLLSSSVLDLQIEMSHVSELLLVLAKIGKDNTVDTEESTEYEVVLKELLELLAAIFSIVLWKVEKEKPPVLAHRRLN